MSTLIRARQPADDAAIVALIGRQEPDGPPISMEEYRAEADEALSAGTGERWVSVLDGTILGVAQFSHAWWTHDPSAFMVEVRVDEERWGRGIGSSLYDTLLARLLTRGATHVLGWVREDAASGRRFVERHGFRPTGQVIEECRLDLEKAQLDAFGDLEARMNAAGIRIVSVAETGPDDGTFLRAIQRVSAGGKEPQMTLEAWRAVTLDSPGVSPGTYWVAMCDGIPVGLTFLKRLSDDAAENDFTGVLPEFQGRGIAHALKLRAIQWGLENGLRSFHTSSLVENERMIGINRRLGYVAGVRRMEVTKDV